MILQLAGDWKNLRRAFKKLDKTGTGLLTLPEFRNVLKLANVVMDEDEVYNVMHTFDEDLSGRYVSCRTSPQIVFKPLWLTCRWFAY